MNKRMLYGALAVAALVSVAGTVAFTSPAFAGPFENANAYYGAKYGVPDFTFTKSEFGNTNLGQLIHLGKDVVVEAVFGATVIYNPATDEVQVWGSVGGYSEGKDAAHYPEGSGCFGTFGTVVWFGTQPHCVPGSSVGPASTSPTAVLLSSTPATARECSFDAGSDGKDEHSC